jgi:hypothetical protein
VQPSSRRRGLAARNGGWRTWSKNSRIKNSSHTGSFTYWTFAALVLVKPQLFLDFPDLRVRHQGSTYHYDPIMGHLAMDGVRKP